MVGASVAAAPCAPAFGRMELIYFRTYPGFSAAAGSLHPGLRLCRPAGWTLEAQVIAQKRGANLGHPAAGWAAGPSASLGKRPKGSYADVQMRTIFEARNCNISYLGDVVHWVQSSVCHLAVRPQEIESSVEKDTIGVST